MRSRQLSSLSGVGQRWPLRMSTASRSDYHRRWALRAASTSRVRERLDLPRPRLSVRGLEPSAPSSCEACVQRQRRSQEMPEDRRCVRKSDRQARCCSYWSSPTHVSEAVSQIDRLAVLQNGILRNLRPGSTMLKKANTSPGECVATTSAQANHH